MGENNYLTPNNEEFSTRGENITMDSGNSIKSAETLSTGAKVGWFILGFCIPIVGLILWLVWMKEEPEKSKYCRNGFIASVIAAVVMYVLLFAFSAVLLSSMSMSLPG